MRSELLTCLDAHWAARLGTDPTTLRNHDTNIISDPNRTGAEVWLFEKTCVMNAEPKLARALKESVGKRNPVVAFEPSRLREAISEFKLDIIGPESIMAYEDSTTETTAIRWITTSETESELEAAVRGVADGIPMVAFPLGRRPVRRAAEAAGFKLYATVIFLGERQPL